MWWAGSFYLLNKIFLSLSERAMCKNRGDWAKVARVASWIAYLVGLPAWVWIFVEEHNWIAAGVETSGLPAMLLGLVIALRGKGGKSPKILDRIALFFIPVGFLYSLYDFGGFNSFTQLLETLLVVGFLVGTYQLAKERLSGYLWFVLMHVACAWLMWVQDYQWLFLQQVVSLLFVYDAYMWSRAWRKRGQCS